MIRAAAFALALLCVAHPLRAETDVIETAERAAEMLEQAGFALLEADGARDRVEALTETVRAYEVGLLAMREGIRQVALRERTILTVFQAERERLARLLGVLQTIEASPDPLLLIHPQGPLGTARSGMIVADIAPAVIAEAQALRGQLQELAALREVQDSALGRLATALDRAQEARTGLSQAIADRRSLPPNFTSDEVAMEDLVSSVESLDAFARLLQEAPETGTDLPLFETARGNLSLPVLGSRLRSFNETDAAGVARPGLVYATRPGAIVLSPWPGTVRYAGPLLDYGNVIILEPDGTYLLILAGLGPIYVRTGDLVDFDTALGLMPGGALTQDAGLLTTPLESGGVTLSETLYIELREDGTPIDPAEWFAQDGTGRN